VVLDHDIAAGLVRGVLCSGCNSEEGKRYNRQEPRFVACRRDPQVAAARLDLPDFPLPGEVAERRRRASAPDQTGTTTAAAAAR
jgi:hypothetical protein